jgi:CRP/FNR family transcriptional activator FtrB
MLGKPHPVAIRTITKSRILMIPADALREVFYKDASLARTLVMQMSTMLRSVAEELINQKARSSSERLAAWVLAASNGNKAFDLPYPKRVLASKLGMAQAALSRCFASIASFATVDGDHITITNRKGLEQIANTDGYK